MSSESSTPETDTTTPSEPSPLESISRAQAAVESLSAILPSIASSLTSSENPAFSLLHDPETASQITCLLRRPGSGAGDNHLCRWLYDTFQSSDPGLQLVVLRHLPTVVGIYLSRISLRSPLAGFEAVLLALYAHETIARAGQAVTVNVPDLSHPSAYHEANPTAASDSTCLNIAVMTPSLEPHGTMRSTRRARIVGVALELYYSKISQMPVGSKIDFCEFCAIWAGQEGGEASKLGDEPIAEEEREVKGGRIPLPWELLQPVLRILGHCLLGSGKSNDKDLREAASAACQRVYARALHDIDPKAILASESLLRLGKMAVESNDGWDPTEIAITSTITL